MLEPHVIACLACPTCKGSLMDADKIVCCRACKRRFVYRGQALPFIPAEAEHPTTSGSDGLIVRCKNSAKRFPQIYKLIVAVFGASGAGISPKRFVREYAQGVSVLVNLGSGAGERIGKAIHIDLFAFPGVDIVADITHLPFREGSVDAIMCMQVLEHVQRPLEVIREIKRVLKPGGVCYLTTPFLYPYHSSPHDYRRWTLDGLRILTVGLEEVRGGTRHGPTSALMILLAQWLAAMGSFGSTRLFEIESVVWMMLLAPLAHPFDVVLSRFRIAENIASGYYLIVRKPGT